jgi:hypothetical protein
MIGLGGKYISPPILVTSLITNIPIVISNDAINNNKIKNNIIFYL